MGDFERLGMSASPASTARSEWHGVDDECRAVVIQKVDHLNDTPAISATNYQPLLAIDSARESTTGVPDDGFDLANRAAVLRGVLAIPIDPSELVRRHYLTI